MDLPEKLRSVRWRPTLCFALLLFFGCQPYLDQAPDDGFPATPLAELGVRRRLGLSHLESSSNSLLMVFNQPLRSLDSAQAPPFQPVFVPPLASNEVSYEGVAGIRVSFAAPLVPSKPYTLQVPAGWRALTGALLSEPLERLWRAPSAQAPEEAESALAASLWERFSPSEMPSLPDSSQSTDQVSSGVLHVPQPWVGADDPVVVVGSPLSASGPTRGRLRLVDSGGEERWSADLCWPQGGAFVARVAAPRQPGRYRLEFLPFAQTAPWRGDFWTCPRARPGESYQLRLEGGESTDRPFQAVLERGGPRHREVDLRAYLIPSEREPEEEIGSERELGAEEVGADQRGRSWLPLGWSQQEQLTLETPDQDFGGTLVVEAVDRADPELVLATLEQPLNTTLQDSTLPGELSTPEGEPEIPLELERWDGIRAQVKAGDVTRLRGQSGTVVGWSPVIPSWSSAARAGRTLGTRPLLPWDGLKADELGGWQLGHQGEVQLAAPSLAGLYRYWSIEPLTGLTSALDVEIQERTRWVPAVPLGVRPGDRFRAGPRFIPGPLKGPVGLTASVSRRGTPSSGYVTTAGLAKGKEETLLFDYQAPSDGLGTLPLHWQVGWSGHRQALSAEISVWPTPPLSQSLTVGKLITGENAVLTAPQAWRVKVESSGPSELLLVDPKGSEQTLRLDGDGPALTVDGAFAGKVRLRQLTGKTPVTYRFLLLDPELGQSLPWASRVYLERTAVDASGRPVTRWSVEGGMALTVSLLNPRGALSGQLKCPLPAGVEPLALVPLSSQAMAVPWTFEHGTMSWEVRDLPAGEALWKIELKESAWGDFLWPSARFTSPTGELWARSGSSRFRVEP